MEEAVRRWNSTQEAFAPIGPTYGICSPEVASKEAQPTQANVAENIAESSHRYGDVSKLESIEFFGDRYAPFSDSVLMAPNSTIQKENSCDRYGSDRSLFVVECNDIHQKGTATGGLDVEEEKQTTDHFSVDGWADPETILEAARMLVLSIWLTWTRCTTASPIICPFGEFEHYYVGRVIDHFGTVFNRYRHDPVDLGKSGDEVLRRVSGTVQWAIYQAPDGAPLAKIIELMEDSTILDRYKHTVQFAGMHVVSTLRDRYRVAVETERRAGTFLLVEELPRSAS